MSVKILFFAGLREALGTGTEALALPAGVATVGGLRDLLVARGERVEGRTITAMVPVSLRAQTERGATGNRVANVHALLPVGLDDPSAVLRTVQRHERVDRHRGDMPVPETDSPSITEGGVS